MRNLNFDEIAIVSGAGSAATTGYSGDVQTPANALANFQMPTLPNVTHILTGVRMGGGSAVINGAARASSSTA